MEKSKKFVMAFLSLAMLFIAAGAFTQEVEISPWNYGLETSFGVTSENEFPGNWSASFQGIHDIGSGLSLDYIHRQKNLINEYGVSYSEDQEGLLGSVFLGFPISKFFIPYIGGGLGFGFSLNNDDRSFAWKVDGGITSRLTDFMYLKAGVTYDNIRESMSISAGVGLKFEKYVTAYYRDYDGSTFRRTWTKFLWQDNSTPTRVYDDKLVSQEVVRMYQENTTSSSYSRARYEFKTSGGETYTTTYKDSRGNTVGTASTTTPTKFERVKTKDATTTTTTYLWNVTVTRNWYTRTWYYKDRAPTTERVYQDEESAVLANKFSETEKM